MPKSQQKRNLMPHLTASDNTQTDKAHHIPGACILVVEDTRDIANLVQLHLRDEGHEVETAFDGLSGWGMLEARRYDLVILDLMLPGMDGLELCRRLRAQKGFDSAYTPILMLTSKGTEMDRVLGLELGADDYLTKPFSIRELMARVKALFRRVEAMKTAGGASGKIAEDCLSAEGIMGQEKICSGELCIEIIKRRVSIDGEMVSLTAKEFDLLYQFACHPGRVYTRTQLLDGVWGLGYEGYEHTVNSHINRLRTKIEKDPAHPHYLLTVWGVGYKFCDSDN
jgi:DNA-binding response OmpR family regulator